MPILVNCRLSDPAGMPVAGHVAWDEGKITSVGRGEPPARHGEEINGRGLLVAPAFTDLWADWGEPGHENRETIASGSAAAAAGGYSTVCARPACEAEEAVRWMVARAREVGLVDLLPLGVLSAGMAGRDLADHAELADAGVRCVADADQWISDTGFLRHAMVYASGFGLCVFLANRDPGLGGGAAHEGPVSTRLGLRAVPSAAEEVAVARHIALAALTRARTHLLKLSSAAGVRLVRDAKARGVPVTASVSIHNLVLDERALSDFDPMYKVMPPLRGEEDRQALLRGVEDGTIDAIVSDHSPAAVEEKALEFDAARAGAVALDLVFPLVNGLVRDGELSLGAALRALNAGPRKVLGLPDARLAAGEPADVVLLDRETAWEVTPSSLQSKGKNTPFLGRTLRGRVAMTVRGGSIVSAIGHD